MGKKMNDAKTNKKLCSGCSSCCEYVTVDIESPKTKEGKDLIRWYLIHGVSVCLEGKDDWMVYIPQKCKMLDKNGECNMYSKRPTICREYTQKECDKYDQNDAGDITFIDEKTFLNYMKKNNKR
jgi:uncharacterized protein